MAQELQQNIPGATVHLISRGVSSLRIATRGVGESEPIASNATEPGRQENRRIEVAIYASDKLQEEARPQTRS